MITNADVTEIKIGQAKVSSSPICVVNFANASVIPLGREVVAKADALASVEVTKSPAFDNLDLRMFFTI